MSHTPQSPNINPLTIRMCCDQLWSHIVWTSNKVLNFLLWVKESCKAKIRYLRLNSLQIVLIIVGVFDQDILRLDIPMYDLLLVHVVQC